jgi:hypothetical protein
MTPSNEDRAERARNALEEYHEDNEDAFGELESEAGVLVDLLTDLMHYCAENGISFKRKLATARIHFEAEFSGRE